VTARAKTLLDKLVTDDRELTLQCAVRVLLANPDDLDARINVVGAQHQAHWLRNRIEPYLREFGAHDEAWMRRCLERLMDSEGDDWAVRALLFSPAPELLALAHERARHLVFAARQPDLMGGATESIGLARGWTGVATDFLCIGWREAALEVVEVQYAKSVLPPQELRDPLGRTPAVSWLGGNCSFGRFRSARLPYGSSYWYDDQIVLHSQAESIRAYDALPEWVHRAVGARSS
jgi:hypothetical protein